MFSDAKACIYTAGPIFISASKRTCYDYTRIYSWCIMFFVLANIFHAIFLSFLVKKSYNGGKYPSKFGIINSWKKEITCPRKKNGQQDQ
jgi:hypothetical protein